MKISELWLVWRVDDLDAKDRRRFRVGILRKNDSADEYTFLYDYSHDFLAAVEAGFDCYPGFNDTNKDKKYVSNGQLFSNIASRLPKPERDDYLDLLNRYGLSKDDDEFTQLSITRGRQVTDNFEFVPAFSEDKIEFDVAGVAHRKEEELKKCIKSGVLMNGAKLRLELEPDNNYDKNAIRILLPAKEGDVLIGYVPRYYSKELTETIKKGTKYSAIVTRVDLGSALRDEKISAKIRLLFE